MSASFIMRPARCVRSYFARVIASVLLVGMSVGLFPTSAFATLPSGFEMTTIASGLTLPTTFAFTPDGRIFIAEKDGTVRISQNGVLLAEPLIKLSDVNSYADRGLIGMAVDPNFTTNGYLYLSYTYENTPGANFAGVKTGRIVRVTVDGNRADESTKVVLVGTTGGDITTPSCENYPAGTDCIPSDSPSHSVGGLAFGPDGKLYATTGDGAHFDYVDARALRAQNIDSLAGKVLRINPDGTAPADNPFYNGNPNANRSKVFAYGVRNMYRFTFRPKTGGLYGGDVGWSTWEEVNLITRGGNYGWPCREGNFATSYGCTAPGAIDPLYVYGHNNQGAGAVTGGAFPSASAYPPQFDDTLFFGDYAQNWVKELNLSDTDTLVNVTDFSAGVDGTNGPVSFMTGPDGNIYYIAIYTGELKRITHTSGNRRPIVSLSANPTSGVTPLSVAFSSAGSLDPDGDAITYRWDFGDGAMSSAANPTHIYTTNALRTASLTIEDSHGAQAITNTVIQAGNQKPNVRISAPSAGALYNPGQIITLTGDATDPEDGAPPASAYNWKVILHHNTHTHLMETHTGPSATFVGPDHQDPNVYTEIELSVTDSQGLVGKSSVNVYLNNGQTATNGNLIQNPSMEEVDTIDTSRPRYWSPDWWGDLDVTYSYPVSGFEGANLRGGKVTITRYGGSGDAKWLADPIIAVPNGTYTYSDYYMSDVTTRLIAGFGFANGTWQYVELPSTTPAQAWTKVERTFTAPADARYVRVSHILSSVGSLTVDTHALALGTSTPVTPPPPPPPPPPTATNLIANPSVETPSATSPTIPEAWLHAKTGTNQTTFSYPAAGFDGARGVEVAMTLRTSGNAKWYWAEVPVTPGTAYTYDEYYHSNVPTSVIARYRLSTGVFRNVTLKGTVPASSEWGHLTYTLTPPADATKVTVMHQLARVGVLGLDAVRLAPQSGTTDTSAPVATLTAPPDGATLSGVASLGATASDNVGVVGVQFTLDGTPVGAEDQTAPYEFAFDTRTYPNGSHTIGATARDAAGNLGSATTRSVTFNNTTGTPSNLIANPSLETAGASGLPLSWNQGGWGANNAAFTYPVTGIDGAKAAKVAITTYTDGDAKWYFNDVPVQGGQLYVFTDRFQASVPTALVARYTASSGAVQYVDLGSQAASPTGWATANARFTVPTDAVSMTIFHLLPGAGTLSIDAASLSLDTATGDDKFSEGLVSLTFDDGWRSHYTNVFPILSAKNMKGTFYMISTKLLSMTKGNQIANPGFETAANATTPSGWSPVSSGANNATFTYPAVGNGSARAATVTITSHTSGNAHWNFTPVFAAENEPYRFTDFYKSDVTTQIFAHYVASGGGSSDVLLATVSPAADWTGITTYFNVPPGTAAMTIFHALPGVGQLTVDDTELEQINLYVDVNEGHEMQAAGNEIAVHTRTHSDLTTVSPAQLTSETQGARSDIVGAGFSPANTFAYPYGAYNDTVITAVRNAGHVGARSTDPGYNLKTTDRYKLKTQQVDINTTVDQAKQWIDTAKSSKTWLTLMFHQVDDAGGPIGTTPPRLQEIVDYLASQNVRVVTVTEGLGLMNP